MSLFDELVRAVEEARGAATEADDEDQAWAGRLCEQLAVYLGAPPEAVHYLNADGEVMLHVGFPQLRDDGGWKALRLLLATDSQRRHRFLLPLRFRKCEDGHQVALGGAGPEFVVPSQSEEFFDHVFVTVMADLKTKEGREAARRGGVRPIGIR